jgi:hypothetical protein
MIGGGRLLRLAGHGGKSFRSAAAPDFRRAGILPANPLHLIIVERTS